MVVSVVVVAPVVNPWLFGACVLLIAFLLSTAPRARRLAGALLLALCASVSVARAEAPRMVKPSVAMIDPCSLYGSGSLGWYLNLCFLP